MIGNRADKHHPRLSVERVIRNAVSLNMIAVLNQLLYRLLGQAAARIPPKIKGSFKFFDVAVLQALRQGRQQKFRIALPRMSLGQGNSSIPQRLGLPVDRAEIGAADAPHQPCPYFRIDYPV